MPAPASSLASPAAAPSVADLALVADIGGTNARFALIAPGGRDIVSPLILPCADFPGAAEAAETYLRKAVPGFHPRFAAFDVAGPVVGEMAALTNHPWRIEVPAIRSALRLERFELVNDFAALARAVPRLTAADRAVIRAGGEGVWGPIAVIGPGTGLGVGAVIPDGTGAWVPLASEGGHVTMAASDERDDAVLAHLRRRFGHVSAERVISGPGLANLYDAVCALAGAPAQSLTPEQVAERASAGERLPKEALELFFAMLGNVAGNLALTMGAQGGVAIAGGIVPRYLAQLSVSSFERRFLDKGRLRSYLEPIPVYVVTHPLPAFIGLAGLLAEAGANDSVSARRPLEKKSTADVLAAALPLAGRSAIDVGCGDGGLVRFMSKAGARVIGIEPGAQMIQLAREATSVGDERYLEAPAERLPLKDGSADLVVFSNSLHHVPIEAQPMAMAEAARVLKKGGTLFVAEPLADGPFFAITRLFNDETDVRMHALAALRDAGRWKLEQVEEFVYLQPLKSRDFAAFRDRSIAIEASRARAFAAHESEIRRLFEESGKRVADGIEFENPTRVNIFRKR